MKPTIIIKHNRFLDPYFVKVISAEYKGWKPPSQEEVENAVEKYRDVWEEEGENILSKMEHYFGLNFVRNIIDVHVVSGNPRPFSSPIVMKASYTKEGFIEDLTHELIHILLKDNAYSLKALEEAYPHEEISVIKHIPVYKAMLYIFKDNSHIKNIKKNIKGQKVYERAFELAG